MTTRIALISFALLSFLGLSAQQDIVLRGVVIEQNSLYNTGQKRYLEGVNIKAAKATATSSDSEGRFELVFADQPLGNEVAIDVDKLGYELVNYQELESATVIGRTEPLTVVMCKEGSLYESQVAYYEIAINAVRRTYESKVKKLSTDGASQREVIEELEKSYQINIQSAEEALQLVEKNFNDMERYILNLSREFAISNLDDASELYRAAFAAFTGGNISEAIQLLETDDVEDRLQKSLDQLGQSKRVKADIEISIKERGKQLKQDVEQAILLAQLLNIDGQFEKAEANYLLALKYDPNNYEALDDYGDFLANVGRSREAIQFFEKALQLNEDEKQYGLLLSTIGICQIQLHEFDAAINNLRKSLEIARKELEVDDPWFNDVNRESYILSLVNLGTALFSKGDFTEAEKLLVEAHQSLATIEVDNEDQGLFNDLEMLTNFILGTLYYDLGDHKKALNSFTEVLNKFEIKEIDSNSSAFSQSRPESIYTFLASSKYNMGDVEGAQEDIQKAIALAEDKSKKNPLIGDPALATARRTYGKMLWEIGEFNQAKEELTAAVEINRKYVEIEPSTHEPYLAETLSDLGNFHLFRNQPGEALIYYNESQELYQKYLSENTRRYQINYLRNEGNIGVAYERLNMPEKAREKYFKALELEDYYEDVTYNTAKYDIAFANGTLGAHLFYQQDYPHAEQYLLKAVNNYELIDDLEGSEKQLELAFYYYLLANCITDTSEILSYLQKSLKEYEPHLNPLPEAYRSQYADLLYRLGTYYSATNQYQEAIPHLEEAHELIDILSKEFSDYPKEKLAIAKIDLGSTYFYNGGPTEPKTLLAEGIALYNELPAINNDIFQLQFLNGCQILGDIYLSVEENYEVVNLLLDKLPLVNSLSSLQYPATPFIEARIKRTLGQAYFGLQLYQQSKPLLEAALAFYEQFLPNLDPISKVEYAHVNKTMGALWAMEKEFTAAEKAHSTSLEIYKEFQAYNPSFYSAQVANMQSSLGMLNAWSFGNPEKAIQFLELALETYNTIPGNFFDQQIAGIHNNLGLVYGSIYELSKAEKHLDAAFSERTKWVGQNPSKLFNIRAKYGFDLLNFYSSASEHRKSLSYRSKALGVIEKLENLTQDPYLILPYKPQIIEQLNQNRIFFTSINKAILAQLAEVGRLEQLAFKVENSKEKLDYCEEILAIFAQPEFNVLTNSILTSRIANNYGSAAWAAILNREFVKAEQYARIGLIKSPYASWINTNLALSYLFQDKLEDAKNIYRTYKDSPIDHLQSFRDVFLKDLSDLEEKGIVHAEFATIRAILNQ